MHGLRFTILLSLLMVKPPASRAQFYFYNDRYLEPRIRLEAGVQAGVMNALTDLGGNRGPAKNVLADVNPEATHFTYGVFAQAYFGRGLSIRLQWANGRVSGADSLAPDKDPFAQQRFQRNLHFSSRIREAAVLVQIEPLQFWGRSEKKYLISPYLLAGLGRFQFNPEARLNDQWIALAPLATEGQEMNNGHTAYPLTQWNLPAGGGLMVELSAKSCLHIEFLYRKLFTDYLDDVSTYYISPETRINARTGGVWREELADRRLISAAANGEENLSNKRGNPRAKDSYFSLMIHWGWVLNRRNRQTRMLN